MGRELRHHLTCVIVLLATVLVAGCGGTGGAGEEERSSKRAADKAADADRDDGRAGRGGGAQVEAQLKIRLEQVGDPKGGAGIPVPSGIACDRSIPATCRGELTCPAEEDERDARICAWLAAEGKELLTTPPPEHEACTQQYGGPEVATVTGTVDGERVHATFTRTQGCEIHRFDQVSPLWTGVVDTGDETATPPTAGEVPEPEVITDPPEAFDY